jgi:hypothetical protein
MKEEELFCPKHINENPDKDVGYYFTWQQNKCKQGVVRIDK